MRIRDIIAMNHSSGMLPFGEFSDKIEQVMYLINYFSMKLDASILTVLLKKDYYNNPRYCNEAESYIESQSPNYVAYIPSELIDPADVGFYMKTGGDIRCGIYIEFKTGIIHFCYRKPYRDSKNKMQHFTILPVNRSNSLREKTSYHVRSKQKLFANDLFFDAPDLFYTTDYVLWAIRLMMNNQKDRFIPDQFTFKRYGMATPAVPRMFSYVQAAFFNILAKFSRHKK